jgi:uncharacterized paraquat-inducible protein A
MVRSLTWVDGDAKGWDCSNCQWRFSVPALLSGEEAICLTVCCTAIKLLRDDSVAWLVGSLASSA